MAYRECADIIFLFTDWEIIFTACVVCLTHKANASNVRVIDFDSILYCNGNNANCEIVSLIFIQSASHSNAFWYRLYHANKYSIVAIIHHSMGKFEMPFLIIIRFNKIIAIIMMEAFKHTLFQGFVFIVSSEYFEKYFKLLTFFLLILKA